jgi:hypothetical protein
VALHMVVRNSLAEAMAAAKGEGGVTLPFPLYLQIVICSDLLGRFRQIF